VATGNGKFTVASGGHDYGDSLLKLSGTGLKMLDFFTPFNEKLLNEKDADLGSGGPVLLPGGRVLVGGKDGGIYLLDREKLGKYQADSNSNAVQVIKNRGGVYAAPAYWNGRVYILQENQPLAAFPLKDGRLADQPDAVGTQRFGNPGATPAISANGTRNGIVWLIETKTWNGTDRPAVLHAYDASNVAKELYTTEQNADHDRVGLALRFTIPTVVNGRVYVNAKRHIDVYGLLPSR
jgi:hypothetical protein